MMMLKKITMICGLSVLAACAAPVSESPVLANTQPEIPVQAASEVAAAPEVQAASEVATQPESESLPYPDLDKQKQIDQLSIQIKKMEQKIAQLNTRISQLERRAAAPAPQKSPPPKARPNKPRVVKISQTLPEKQPETAQNEPNEPAELPVNPLRVAQNLYAEKQYHAAIEQLRGADSGGDGSLNAQQQMYLLLQSHLKLQHCQSVIQIGRQFASRFADNANAPHALFAVGQCQWQIQQRDIAKDTWRDIMRRYPKSPIAKAAERAMQQK